MDELFGYENFVSQIIWKRSDAHNDAKTFGAVHDMILFYRKSEDATFHIQHVPLSDKTADSWYNKADESGRHYSLVDLSSPHPRPYLTYEYKGVAPPTNGWRYSKEKMQEMDERGLVIRSGSTLKLKRYLDESKGTTVSDLWTDISQIRGYTNNESSVAYPTQKPIALLQRIIAASTNPGDLVLDCFSGSGTTAVAAETMKVISPAGLGKTDAVLLTAVKQRAMLESLRARLRRVAGSL